MKKTIKKEQTKPQDEVQPVTVRPRNKHEMGELMDFLGANGFHRELLGTQPIPLPPSVPSPRPDGWEERFIKYFTHPCSVVKGRLDLIDFCNAQPIMDFIRQELTSQHHKDIEAFRGMIEGMIKKSPEVCHKGKHCDICSHISDRDQALIDVLTALSKMEEEK